MLKIEHVTVATKLIGFVSALGAVLWACYGVVGGIVIQLHDLEKELREVAASVKGLQARVASLEIVKIGPTTAAGQQGLPGPRGEPGPPGPQGPKGDAGPVGSIANVEKIISDLNQRLIAIEARTGDQPRKVGSDLAPSHAIARTDTEPKSTRVYGPLEIAFEGCARNIASVTCSFAARTSVVNLQITWHRDAHATVKGRAKRLFCSAFEIDGTKPDTGQSPKSLFTKGIWTKFALRFDGIPIEIKTLESVVVSAQTMLPNVDRELEFANVEIKG